MVATTALDSDLRYRTLSTLASALLANRTILSNPAAAESFHNDSYPVASIFAVVDIEGYRADEGYY